MLSFAILTDAPPFLQDEYGAVRVGSSRVLLELVVRAFQDGATPEAIVLRYPTLTLPDVYATVAYYLHHRQDVDNYLVDREHTSVQVQSRIEQGQRDVSEIRSRILAQAHD